MLRSFAAFSAREASTQTPPTPQNPAICEVEDKEEWMKSASIFDLLMFKGKIIEVEDLRMIFLAYDGDKNGVLDHDELTSMVHDLYQTSINSAKEAGASDRYIEKARIALESERGRDMVEASVQELLELRDTSLDGTISWDELRYAFDAGKNFHEKKGTYWRLAPLADVKMDLNSLVEPYPKSKIFVAGAVAGGVAKTVGSPLSRITIILQTAGMDNKLLKESAQRANLGLVGLAKDILKKEGYRGFFKGNGTDVMRSVPYGGINYLAYEAYKKLLLPYDTSHSGASARFLAGGMSGVSAIAITYPLDLVRTRLAVQGNNGVYKGTAHAFRCIIKEEGPLAIYRGLPVALSQTFPNLAINYSLFEVLRNAVDEKGYRGMFVSLGCGVAAGTLANSITFPIDVVQRRMQLVGADGGSTVMTVVRELWSSNGVRAFYAGILPQLMKAVPVGATSFAMYDTMKRVLDLELN